MTDRVIVYSAALPQTTDVLNTSKMAMLGDAFLAVATLGNNATSPAQVVAGLACTPTSPASLQVNVGPGAIFQFDTVDTASYGDLGTDANQVYKMGIREALGALTITPPSTAGYSQVFLVQAILSDIDAGSTVLSYYNSANPAIPYSGPNNAGTSQFTTRTCVCTIALKAGVAAPTGSQATPAPDTGYIGLYAVTVANGATTILSGNIVQSNGGFAPFVNTALPYIPSGVQIGGWVSGVDTGTANNVVVALAPVPAALVANMMIRVKMLNAPTGASVINVNGLGNKSIVKGASAALQGGEWQAGQEVQLCYDGTNWQMQSAFAPTAVFTPRARITLGAIASIPFATYTAYGTTLLDSSNLTPVVSANSFTLPAGTYLFIGNGSTTMNNVTANTNAAWAMRMTQNGGTQIGYDIEFDTLLSGQNATTYRNMVCVATVAATDTLAVQGYVATTNSSDYSSGSASAGQLSIVRLGP